MVKIITTTLSIPKKIYTSKMEGVDPTIIQKMQQEWDEDIANKKRKEKVIGRP
tara:strand:+ start:888 stop:1046 length:159 start_codon:yes stop_codon:yes gene_type:complete